MYGTSLVEILWALALFFMNPLFIFSILMAVLLGYFRVKRERRHFNIRLMPGLTELRRLFSESWALGIAFSIFIAGIGFVVDSGWLVLFCAVSFVVLVLFMYKLTSPVYYSMIASVALFFLVHFAPSFTYRGWTAGEVDLLGELAFVIPLLTGLLVLAEGLITGFYGGKDASTLIKRTSRGMKGGIFNIKRLWVLPIIFIVPGEMIASFVTFWPLFTLGEASFTLLPIPVVIGFSQRLNAHYPDLLMPVIGRRIVLLGLGIMFSSVLALWYPILGWVVLGIGAIGRVLISVIITIGESKGEIILSPSSSGVVIAGVLPGSPADRLGLLPGESIQTVNGQEVNNETELYHAIQINAAHCRLTINGRDGEVRLLQEVVYHHDHHRLGILVIE